jgi:hypothetical protein
MMTKKQKHFEQATTTDRTRHDPPRYPFADSTLVVRLTRAMDEHNKDTAVPDVVPEAGAQDSTTEENSTQDNTALEVTSLNSEKQAVLANPEALENSDYEDDDAPPVDQIAADEGAWAWD